MKKYDLKRAIVKVIEESRVKSDKDLIRLIRLYQAEIIKLKAVPEFKRTDKTFLEYQRELQKCRSKLKNFRSQRYVFNVYVKQYEDFADIEWTFQNEVYGAAYQKQFRDMLKGVVNRAIQYCRARLKVEPKVDRFGKFYSSFLGNRKKYGRVFSKEGEILRVYVEKNIQTLYVDKTPTEPRKYIGIELEFCAPIKEHNFALKLFKSGIHKFAQLKNDGSLRPLPNEVGYELAILLEESNYKKRLKQITNVLTEVGAVAKDRRAGLHVHLDMRRRNKDLVYNNLVACQYALLSIVDPRRYNNEFCRFVESRKFPTEFTGQREERYRTINAAAFYKYKTLEVRMHEGSVDYTQIMSWVDLLIRIANCDKKMKNDVTKISTLSKRIPLEKKLYAYLQDRSCFWQVRNDDYTQAMRQHINEHAALQRPDVATIDEINHFMTTGVTLTTANGAAIRTFDLTTNADREIMNIERPRNQFELQATTPTLEEMFPPAEEE